MQPIAKHDTGQLNRDDQSFNYDEHEHLDRLDEEVEFRLEHFFIREEGSQQQLGPERVAVWLELDWLVADGVGFAERVRFAERDALVLLRRIVRSGDSAVLRRRRPCCQHGWRRVVLRACYSPAPMPMSRPFACTAGLIVRKSTRPSTGAMTVSSVSPNSEPTLPIACPSRTTSFTATAG